MQLNINISSCGKIQYLNGDFPCGTVVKYLPCSARDTVGLIPGWRTKIPHASEQLSPCATTRVCAQSKILQDVMKTLQDPTTKTQWSQINKLLKKQQQHIFSKTANKCYTSHNCFCNLLSFSWHCDDFTPVRRCPCHSLSLLGYCSRIWDCSRFCGFFPLLDI